VTRLTEITPHQVWLGVVAVCTVSYVSYLLQRFIAPAGAALWVALLGGLYSSTATTVVLARRARAQPATLAAAQTGIILATAVMYLRLLAVILVFSRPLAAGLAPGLLGLSVLGFVLAGLWHWKSRTTPRPPSDAIEPGNPLELGAAAVFAIAFVLVSLATAWAQANFGVSGLYVLAGVVGVSDIDPFVLSLAEHGTGQVPLASEVVAILIGSAGFRSCGHPHRRLVEQSAEGGIHAGVRRSSGEPRACGGPCADVGVRCGPRVVRRVAVAAWSRPSTWFSRALVLVANSARFRQ